MSSGALGLQTMQNEFSTPRMRAVWNDKNRVQRICEVERTLAEVEGELGVIPREAAEEISRVCRYENVNMRELYLSSAKSGHFTSGFVKYMQDLMEDGAGEYIHYGVTTQDILDTSFILQLKDAHKLIVDGVTKICRDLAKIANEHKQTVTAGRAHGNHAVPTTVGFKAAVTLNELARYLNRLQECEDFVFTGVIAGSVGTYAALGEKGPEIEKGVMEKLGLSAPEVYWHTQRDRYVEYMHILAMISGALAKVGQDLFDLSRSEIREFEEGYLPGRQGSTTMPTMQNPYMCEAVINLGNLIANAMPLMYSSMRVSHEKDTIAWRNQWVVIPEICMYLSGQLNYLHLILHMGNFNKEAIERNLDADQGMMMSERIMIDLGKQIGKQTAHQLLYDVANEARDRGERFDHVLKGNNTIQAHYTVEEINDLLDPHTYIGYAVEKTDQILMAWNKRKTS